MYRAGFGSAPKARPAKTSMPYAHPESTLPDSGVDGKQFEGRTPIARMLLGTSTP